MTTTPLPAQRRRAAVITALVAVTSLLVLAPPAGAAPSNDALLNAVVITGEHADLTGSNVGATRQSSEPDHAGRPGNSSVWFKWTAPTTAWTTVDTCGSSISTVLAVYTGPNVTALTEVAASGYSHRPHRCQDTFHGAVHFAATAGVTYNIAVDSYFTDVEGAFELHLNPPPVNDAFDSPLPVPQHRYVAETEPTVTGWTRDASQEAGEPVHDLYGTASVWLDWSAHGDGPATIDTCGSDFDTVLAVYTGTAAGALTPVATNDDDAGAGCGANASRVTFTAAIGRHYRIAVAGHLGATGEYRLHLDGSQLTLSNDNFADAVVLAGGTARHLSHNQLGTFEDGEPRWFGDRSGGRTIWYRWTAPSTGPYELDTCDPETDADLPTVLGVHTGDAVDALTPVVLGTFAKGTGRCAGTDHSAVVFDAVAGATYSIQVGGVWDEGGLFEPEFGSVVTTVFPATRPSNDDIAFSRALAGAAATVAQATAGSRSETGEPAHAGAPAAASVWFDWTAGADTEVRIGTCGSDFDTRLAVYRGPAVPVYQGTIFSSLVAVAGNDDAGADACPGGPATSAVSFTASAGTHYRFAVDGRDGATGALVVALAQDAPAPTGWQRVGPVHQTSTELVLRADVAALPGGARLLWWSPLSEDLERGSVQARRVEADGTMGPVVDLVAPGGATVGVDLAVLPDGGLALFTSTQVSLGEARLEARLFGPDLAPTGPPVALTGTVTVPQGHSVVAGPDGALTFAWIDAGEDGPIFGADVARLRRLAPDGTLSPTIDLTSGGNAYGSISIGAAADGRVTAAWQWAPTPPPFQLEHPAVQTLRVAPDGTVGAMSVLDPSGHQPAVGVAPDGSAVVVWKDGIPSDLDTPLLAARIGADGTAGAAVQLDDSGSNGNYNVSQMSVVTAAGGRAFAIWSRQYAEGASNPKQVRGRFIEADGTAGPLLHLSVPSFSDDFYFAYPRAGFDRWGTVTASWSSLSDDGSTFRSQARRIAPDSTMGPVAGLTPWPESGVATDMVVDGTGVPSVAQIRVSWPRAITVELEELPIADLTVTGAATGLRAADFTVANLGPRPSTADTGRPLRVTLEAPAGLEVTAATGAGWTCTTGAGAACTRTATIAAGASAPPIAVAYGPGPAPADPARATVEAGLTLDPDRSNDSAATGVVPTCFGRPATIVGAGVIKGTAGADV
ncbi:MAG TPA: hypothetical protein VFO65_09890, partial [Acidimicrobiales bacterium]|nr:hypothetical protein [Acidimicrobiales bacterium]